MVTEYLGAGEGAEQVAATEARKREERALERQARREELAREGEIDRALDALGAQLRELSASVQRAHGYHPHRGTWRRKRHGQRTQDDGPGGPGEIP